MPALRPLKVLDDPNVPVAPSLYKKGAVPTTDVMVIEPVESRQIALATAVPGNSRILTDGNGW